QYTGQVAKKSNEHLKAFLSNEIIKNKKNKLMRDLTEPLAKKSTSVDNLFSDDKVDNSLIKLNKKQKQVWKPKVEPKFTVGNSFYKVKNIAGDTVHLPLDAAANSLKKYYQDKPAQPKASTYIEKTYSIKLDPLTAHYVDTVAPTRNEPVKTSNPFAPVLDEDKIFMCAQLNEIKV
ncbi:MAG: hypothetical protein JHC93_07330, partial [Parachlamydiales bacterium]|nr:hypothetical protein [Parachlamydiales bacterium]